MIFVNDTALPAAMLANAERDERITGLFLCGLTLDLSGPTPVLARAQRPLLLKPPRDHPGDAAFLKGPEVSVCATGFVYPAKPGERRARAELRVAPLAGAEQRWVIDAIGTRVWRATLGGRLVATKPRPIDRVAMCWENAFGGRARQPAQLTKVDGVETVVPSYERTYALNALGTGFYPDVASATDAPLPQLEDPNHPVRAWNDQPPPVCFAPYPLHGGLRAGFVYDGERVDYGKLSRLSSRGTPRNTFAPLPLGTVIGVAGMRPGAGALAFELPPPPVVVRAGVGERHHTFDVRLDSVEVDTEAREARLVYRAMIRYGLIQFERRVAHLELAEPFTRRFALPK